MKKYILLICALVLSTSAFSQSKKELEAELKSTKAKLDSFQFLYFQQQSQYQQKIVYLESTGMFVFQKTNHHTKPILAFQ